MLMMENVEEHFYCALILENSQSDVHQYKRVWQSLNLYVILKLSIDELSLLVTAKCYYVSNRSDTDKN